MFQKNKWITTYLPLCLLLSLGACTTQESRNLKVYTDAELASRSDRGVFLENYKVLRETPFSDKTAPEIIAKTKAMKEAQSRRLEALENLIVQETKLRSIHGSLLQAERTILNAIVAFEGLIEREKMDKRQYRTNISTLEEAVSEGEPLFTAYESALEEYKGEIGRN